MKHVKTIQAFIGTLMNSENFHALVVQSPPGWGKSTTVDQAIRELGMNAVAVGSYATPLHIYHSLCRHPKSLIILDDCAGLFSDTKAMAILKAATWVSGGTGTRTQGSRRITWGSTSEKVERAVVDFSGKLILLANSVPSGRETEAFLSRCLNYPIQIDDDELKAMLLSAAASAARFREPELALEVARFIIDDSTRVNLARTNLRTLNMGYELASTHPTSWRELFLHLLPREKDASDESRIFQSGLSAKEQEAKFIASTGKSRRTYYIRKKQLGFTRPYQPKSVS